MRQIPRSLTLCLALLASSLLAADFSIDIGNPAAAQVKYKKGNAVLAVRSTGCDDPTKFHVDGNSVQAPGDTHVSAPLIAVQGSVPGVFAVGSTANLEGKVWIMALTAECNGAKAGALIPIDAHGVYNRDAAKFLNHAPTSKEIDEALKNSDSSLKGGYQ